jgi:glycosyltransferase involved in cell wall biosynthesis
MKIQYLAFIRLPTEKAHGLQIIKTCEAFAAAGNTVELVIPARHTPLTEDPYTYYGVQANTFSILRLSIPDLISWGPLGFMLSQLFFSEAAHLRASFWNSDLIYSRDAFVLLQYVLLGRKLVYEAHTRPTRISRFVARRAFRVVVISQGLRMAYEKAGVPPDRIVVAPDGIDPAQFAHPEDKADARLRLGLPGNSIIGLYIGRLDGWKGTGTLFEAAALVPPTVRIAVIGGEPHEVATFKKQYPLVTFLGARPYREIAHNQAAADLLILPNTATDETSAQYTSPLKLFTYLASGRPIIASDLPSIREILDDSTATFFIPDNAQSLADTITNVVADPDGAAEKASRARALAEQYTWDARVNRIQAAIPSL